MGFQRAFMYAGAQSVAVSLWNIYDRNTALLMRYFYTEIGASLKSNATPDYNYALRKAKLTLLNQNDTAHPVYWGSFVIYGI
jgi:CHAT domain-containing protein